MLAELAAANTAYATISKFVKTAGKSLVRWPRLKTWLGQRKN